MKFIDLHCDTLWKLMDLDRKGDLYKSGCAVTIPDMKKAGTVAQFFACFTYLEDYRKGNGYEDAYLHVQEMIDYFEHQMEVCFRISYSGRGRCVKWASGAFGTIISTRSAAAYSGMEL